MAEAGEEEPKRCPCGFWGSPQTNNLCSKCHKECQQQRKEVGSASGDKNATELLTQYDLLSGGLGSSRTGSVEIREPQQDHNEGEKGEPTSEAEADRMNKEKDEAGNFLPGDLPAQMNRKRCWTCKAKLELAQRSLGECKCGYIFCFLHRLPEQHRCAYDHKEGGRQEALKTMVPASKKKFGRSFHRMDSRPEQ
jgi:hypothetical protein